MTPFEVLTFDCYGTLIDWETGLLRALRAHTDADGVLEAFARHEAALEAGPYLTYKEVLAGCLRALGRSSASRSQTMRPRPLANRCATGRRSRTAPRPCSASSTTSSSP